MSKYIDLKEQIVEDSGAISPRVKIGIEEALDWLDEHPDQVPGPTLTVSESKHLFDIARQGLRYWPNALDRAGITVVPDPEPTNTELIEKAIFESMSTASIVTSVDVKILADRLDARGVKASGFDDDH